MIRLENIGVRFGSFEALKNINIHVKEGEFFTFLGPSGCGKTTTLRTITGFIQPSSGTVSVRGTDITNMPVEKRNIGMVFQSYALFPTMTVFENIAFGLKVQKMNKEDIRQKVLTMAEKVDLNEEQLKKKVSELSGGQQQRVAIARALVTSPEIICLDEPLSNLDAKLRGQMRVELIGLHKKLGTTFVYVTHDQVEAMSMADDIVLMKDGYIVQQSSPRELYNNPNCVYAAQFIGTPQMNIVKDILPEGMQVGFRPEKVYLKEVEEEHVEISAKIATKEMLGSEIIYSLDSPAGKLMAKSDYEAEDESTLKLSIPVKNMYLFDKDGKRITLDDERRLMIHAGFAKLAGREV